MRNLFLGALLVALTLTTPIHAADTAFNLADGKYVASFGSDGCGLITVEGTQISYVFAEKACDAQPQNVKYTARHVTIEGMVIHVDEATLSVSDPSASHFEGQWNFNGSSFPVAFKKV